MKILLWDIETSPNLGHVWSLWQQDIGLSQLMETGNLLCFAAKWYGVPKSMQFYSEWETGQPGMVKAAWELMDEADAVVSYNGKRFDTPWINRRFLEEDLLPPSPVKHIDLYETVKRQFNFPSNKLAYVSQRLLGQSKAKHEGHELWTKVLAGDEAAQKRMQRYNTQDVKLLEPLYDKLLPWISGHPSYGALTGEDVCPACGGDNLVLEGFAYTTVGRFQRFHCSDCGKWSRSSKRDQATTITQIAG